MPFTVYATANLSGGHITPTVTIATMITGHIGLLKGIAYIISQLVGAIIGSLLIVRPPATIPPWLSKSDDAFLNSNLIY